MELDSTPSPSGPINATSSSESLLEYFDRVRTTTERLCEPLEIEDMVVQPIVDVSPPKWHLGHTTWFFETLVLASNVKGYQEFDPDFGYMFNSYYESLGDRVLRPNRGFMSRPAVESVMQYRKHVNHHMSDLLTREISPELKNLVTLGLNHEQQHQELLITDLKYILGNNPLFPKYLPHQPDGPSGSPKQRNLLTVDEGVYPIGYEGQEFYFDNERGAHKVFLHSYGVEDRLISAGEYLEFIEDGGYMDFRWWLSEGWEWVKRESIQAPLYWHKIDGNWSHYTLGGIVPVDSNQPVTHVSYFEAEAFASWKGLRLPTEFEWETVVEHHSIDNSGNFMESKVFHPVSAIGESSQFFGDVWEWTTSSYLPYPFYKQADGAVGEYNGKFMVNQMVLRGGSCATPRDHIRATYRNFFHPHLRWQFTGIRLAKSIV